MTEALEEEGIEPPKEGPVVNAAGGLGRVSPKLRAQQAALVDGFEHKDNEHDHDGGGGDVCKDIV